MKLIGAILFLALSCVSVKSMAITLISAKEAALPSASSNKLSTRGISRGPSIKLNAPVIDPVQTPFDFKLTFEPRGGSGVDPDSVKVTYLKFPYVDLTSRIKSAISASGIDLPKVEVPPGSHSIRVTVKDTEGRESQSEINLVVVKP
jgi:hypothetical protein